MKVEFLNPFKPDPDGPQPRSLVFNPDEVFQISHLHWKALGITPGLVIGQLLLVCLLFSLFFEGFRLIVGVGLLCFGLMGLKAWIEASSIRFQRWCPKSLMEGEELVVDYSFSLQPEAPFFWPVHPWLVLDRFSGTLFQGFEVPLPSGILRSPRGLKLKFRVPADAGMGTHQLGPLSLRVQDPLGIFRFKVTDDHILDVDVYPRPLALPELPVIGTPFSQNIGLYDVPLRGPSTNFIGLREYVPGDPIRQISWKLSLRRPGELLVKEFEKTVNSEITYLLNLNSDEQAGLEADSSWEYGKDIVLSLASQHLTNGNSFQVSTPQGELEWGRGRDHCHLLMRWLFPQMPGNLTSLDPWLSRASESVPHGSTVFLVTPVLRTGWNAWEKALRPLLGRDVRLTVVLLDSLTFFRGHGDPDLARLVHEIRPRLNQALADIQVGLARWGASAYLVKGGQAIRQGLSREFSASEFVAGDFRK